MCRWRGRGRAQRWKIFTFITILLHFSMSPKAVFFFNKITVQRRNFKNWSKFNMRNASGIPRIFLPNFPCHIVNENQTITEYRATDLWLMKGGASTKSVLESYKTIEIIFGHVRYFFPFYFIAWFFMSYNQWKLRRLNILSTYGGWGERGNIKWISKSALF